MQQKIGDSYKIFPNNGDQLPALKCMTLSEQQPSTTYGTANNYVPVDKRKQSKQNTFKGNRITEFDQFLLIFLNDFSFQ